jgi:3-methyladenine DNA glycosylase/8-oxoguanine DNA glycosylase
LVRRARTHLRRVDPVIAAVMKTVGPYRPPDRRGETHFLSLVRAIIYQQLSGKAAATILKRFLTLFPDGELTPAGILALSDEQMRAVGMSRQKTGYLRDLAAKVQSGALPLDHVDELSDEDLIDHLVQVKGIGRWTAQMFLMFKLGRLDVLPELDLGIQNAIKRAYRKRKCTPKDVLRIGSKWSPYSSIACWYLWRTLDNGAGQLPVARK